MDKQIDTGIDLTQRSLYTNENRQDIINNIGMTGAHILRDISNRLKGKKNGALSLINKTDNLTWQFRNGEYIGSFTPSEVSFSSDDHVPGGMRLSIEGIFTQTISTDKTNRTNVIAPGDVDAGIQLIPQPSNGSSPFSNIEQVVMPDGFAQKCGYPEGEVAFYRLHMTLTVGEAVAFAALGRNAELGYYLTLSVDSGYYLTLKSIRAAIRALVPSGVKMALMMDGDSDEQLRNITLFELLADSIPDKTY